MHTERLTMKSHVKRTVTAAVLSVSFVGLLAVAGLTGRTAEVIRNVQAQGDNPTADAHAKVFPCSTATLTGRYAIRGEGVVPGGPPPAPMVPFAVVALDTLDGQGQVTDADTASVNGVVVSQVNHGTYTVNEDCSGTLTINIPTPPFQLTHNLVIVDKGNEFYLIASTPSVLTITGKRVD